MEQILISTALAPAIAVVVEAVKRAGFPDKFAGGLAVLLGLIYGGVYAYLEKNPEILLYGILAGGTAVGFYETIAKPSVRLLNNSKKKEE